MSAQVATIVLLGAFTGVVAGLGRRTARRDHHRVAPDRGIQAPATWCGETDRSRPAVPLTAVDGAGRLYQRARILVRDAGQPIAFVDVDVVDGTVDAETALRTAAEVEAAPAPPADRPADSRVSVIVCTRNRPEMLDRCLTSLSRLEPRPYEIIVVDNASTDDRTETVVRAYAAAGQPVRYVAEPTPGLSHARNAGLAAAQGNRVAFTDDDVRVDSSWIAGLNAGFARRDDVACVTGLVAAERLDRPAEHYFDARVSWSSSCTPRLFDLQSEAGPLFPYAAGNFGTGANVAFRTDSLRRLGGFDESLGAGSPTAGGEDLDAFVRILHDGHALAYEPAALVWHRHRDDPAALRKQMFGYGTGLTAYLTKYLIHPPTTGAVVKRFLHGLRHMSRGLRRPDGAPGRTGLPWGIVAIELVGLVYGPIAYLKARRAITADRRRELLP